MPARVAAAPTRFAAYAAATTARSRARGGREVVVGASELRAFLAPLPVATLAPRLGCEERQALDLVATLERLGIAELGALAALSAAAVADRFGPLGLRARRLALRRGRAAPPAASGRGDRRVAGAARGGRGGTARAGAGAAGRPPARRTAARREQDGARAARSRRGWPAAAAGARRRRCAGPAPRAEVLRLVLAPKLGELPGPAETLRLRAHEPRARRRRPAGAVAAAARSSGASGSPRRCARCARPPGPGRC